MFIFYTWEYSVWMAVVQLERRLAKCKACISAQLDICTGCTSAYLCICMGCTSSAQATGSAKLHGVQDSYFVLVAFGKYSLETVVQSLTLWVKSWVGCADMIVREKDFESSILCSEAWNRIQGSSLCISQTQNFLSSSQTSAAKKAFNFLVQQTLWPSSWQPSVNSDE